METERKVAIDSCVLVNFFTDGGDTDPAEWLPASRKVLQAGHASDFRMVASTLTLAEVAGCGTVRGNHLPDFEQKKRIATVREWLQDHRRWLLVDVDPRVAREAANLALEHQLKGPDAVILASALAGKASTLVTWDNDLLKLDHLPNIGIQIVTPLDFPHAQEPLAI